MAMNDTPSTPTAIEPAEPAAPLAIPAEAESLAVAPALGMTRRCLRRRRECYDRRTGRRTGRAYGIAGATGSIAGRTDTAAGARR